MHRRLRRGRNKCRICREEPEVLEGSSGGEGGLWALRHQHDELHWGLGVRDVRDGAVGRKL